MQQSARTSLLAKLALLTVAIIWGSTLVVSKSTTGTIAPNFLIALRFLIAFVLLGIIFFNKLKRINRDYIIAGVVIGFCLFLAHSMQTLGVTDAEGDPGRSGFLSACYCVVVPFLSWLINRIRPDRYNLMAAVLCLFGIGMVSFGDVDPALLAESSVAGFTEPDALALLSGVFFAAHIVMIERFGRGKDPILLTIMQFIFAGLFAIVLVLIREPEAIAQTQWGVVWKAVAYLAVVATAIALVLQNVGQKYTEANGAAIILGTESIFCVLFGVAIYNEKVSMLSAIGFLLIFLAIIVSETKLSFLRSKRAKAAA